MDTENILMYDNTRFLGNIHMTGQLLFGNGSNGFYYSDTNDPYCIGRFGVGGTANNNYMLNVNGSAYVTDALDISGTTCIGGENYGYTKIFIGMARFPSKRYRYVVRFMVWS